MCKEKDVRDSMDVLPAGVHCAQTYPQLWWIVRRSRTNINFIKVWNCQGNHLKALETFTLNT